MNTGGLMATAAQDHPALRFGADARRADVVLGRQPVLEPFADTVQNRFLAWLERKVAQDIIFTPEQRAWLELIRDHIATSLSIEPTDFDYAPFSQRGGLGKAHQLFGKELSKLLDELNEALAA